MSRLHSQSPHYRRFPWEERDFDPSKVLAELDGSPSDRSRPPRKDFEENRDNFRKDAYPEGRRRSPAFSDHQFGSHKHSNREEFYRRRLSPRPAVEHGNRRFSPQCDRGSEAGRRRDPLREDFQGFEPWQRSPHSPPRFAREKLPATPRSHSDHSPIEIGWRREAQGRGRFRDLSPSARSDDLRGPGTERGERKAQSYSKGRRKEDSHQEKSPPFKRQRRETDNPGCLRYGNEKGFREQSYSLVTSREKFGGDFVPHGNSRHSGPLVIEHDHGITERQDPPRWEEYVDGKDRDPDFSRPRSPHLSNSLEEPFTMLNSRSYVESNMRRRRFQDNQRDIRYKEGRSPMSYNRQNPRYGNHVDSATQRGRGGSYRARGRFFRDRGGRIGPLSNERRLYQGYHDHEQQRPGYSPRREDYEDAVAEKKTWPEEGRFHKWKHEGPGDVDRRSPRIDLDPKMPRSRERKWNDQRSNDMNVVTEETLRIKVDMSQPVNQKSPLCYSTDRQLSLDLVNVGRQRLNFLPMLEHSGTFRESAMHKGTFAEEIITLVHHVKELYFRGDGITLNERFSDLRKSACPDKEREELTLDERFSSGRGISLNLKSLPDEDQPLLSRLGTTPAVSKQPMRGPGDLRHDLERRRQERLEGVKVTIPGNSRPQGSDSERQWIQLALRAQPEMGGQHGAMGNRFLQAKHRITT